MVCGSDHARVEHREIQDFQRIAHDEVLEHLCFVLVGDEIEAGRLRVQSVLGQHLFNDFDQFRLEVGDMGSHGVRVHHPRYDGLQMVG